MGSKVGELELSDWVMGDDPVSLAKSIRVEKGVKYLICKVVESKQVMADDHGVPITDLQIKKSAGNTEATRKLLSRISDPRMKSLLAFAIHASSENPGGVIEKALKPGQDPRDGDGDGKIFDGTPQERPARDDVGRVANNDRIGQAVKSPEAAAKLLASTTRPQERVRLVSALKRAGMSDADVAKARGMADSPKDKRPNSQQSEPNKEDAGGRVLFEAAPDPNDKELADQWRGLDDEARVAISRDVVNAVMPKVAEKLGVKLSIHDQLGGYLDDTNPSFAATFDGQVDPAKFMDVMKTAGFAMSQDSMMGISKVPIDGADKAGFVTVELPKGADVHSVYKQIRSLDPSVQGHTTIGDEMLIVDFGGRHNEIAKMVSDNLGYNTQVEEGFAAFVDKGNYGYGSESGSETKGDSKSGMAEVAAKQQWGNDLRRQASDIIRTGIADAKSRSKPESKSGQQDSGSKQPESTELKSPEPKDQSLEPDKPKDWSSGGSFALDGAPDEKGNANLEKGLKIARHDLPQVKASDQKEFLDWLGAQGIGVDKKPVDPASLLPVQSQVNKPKIDKMIQDDKNGVFDIADKPVLVSNDGYLIDGHHRAIAAAANGKQMTGLQVDMTAKDLIKKLEEFPKTFKEGINENRNAPAREVILPMAKAMEVLQSKPWQDYAAKIPDLSEMSKEDLKKTIAELPEPPGPLPNNPELYFNTQDADMVIDSEAVNLSDLPGNPPGAEKLMAAAALGKLPKRAPVDGAMRDGKIAILDGKSTATVANKNGMHIAVKLVENDPEQWFAQKEKMLVKQKFNSSQRSYDEHAQAAKENMDGSDDSFQAVLDLGKGLSRAIGAQVPTYAQALELAQNGHQKPMVLVGPIKTAESAARKVGAKYNGDYSRLTDVIRATVLVPKYHQVGPAMSAMKAELEQHGWSIVEGSGENKFVTPTSAGYRDVSMLIKSPNGQIAEIQVNTTAMWHAKETDGHKLYEQSRLLEHKENRTPEENAELERLLRAQSDLYGNAWERSQ